MGLLDYQIPLGQIGNILSGIGAYKALASGNIVGALTGGLFGSNGVFGGGSSDRNISLETISMPNDLLASFSGSGIFSSYRGAAGKLLEDSIELGRIQELVSDQLAFLGLDTMSSEIKNISAGGDSPQASNAAIAAGAQKISLAKEIINNVLSTPEFTHNGYTGAQIKREFELADLISLNQKIDDETAHEGQSLSGVADAINANYRQGYITEGDRDQQLRDLAAQRAPISERTQQARGIVGESKPQLVGMLNPYLPDKGHVLFVEGGADIGRVTTAQPVELPQLPMEQLTPPSATGTQSPPSIQDRANNLFGEGQLDTSGFTDEDIAKFYEAETAQAELITAQQLKEAVLADENATAEQKTEAERDFNLKIVGFLTGAVGLGALAGGLRNLSQNLNEDLNIKRSPNTTPDFSLGGLIQNQPSQRQAGLINFPEKSFEPVEPVITKPDQPIKKTRVLHQGFPVRGAGILA